MTPIALSKVRTHSFPLDSPPLLLTTYPYQGHSENISARKMAQAGPVKDSDISVLIAAIQSSVGPIQVSKSLLRGTSMLY